MIEWIKSLFSKKYTNILDEFGEQTGYSICLRTGEVMFSCSLINLKRMYVIKKLESHLWKLEHA